MKTIQEYYANLGYSPDHWHIGTEHPHLEEFAIQLLLQQSQANVLEIGYQSGGFAVPVILACQDHPAFNYLGIDSREYASAVDGAVIAGYLNEIGVNGQYKFETGDAGEFLQTLPHQPFDLILIDHYKPLYPRDFYTIASRQLTRDGGYVLFHDVLGRAANEWRECQLICMAFGYTWRIIPEIPGGLAVAQRTSRRNPLTILKQAVARAMLGTRQWNNITRKSKEV